MVSSTQALVVVVILAAVAYIIYLWSRRRNTIECPNCGATIDIYADECPHCGYRKEQALEEHGPGRPETETGTGPEESTAEPSDEEPEEPDEPGEPDEEEGFTCDECGKEFDTERGLKIHSGMQH